MSQSARHHAGAARARATATVRPASAARGNQRAAWWPADPSGASPTSSAPRIPGLKCSSVR
jgi:hypothetical protein